MPPPLLVLAASLAWIGWFAFAPALGFPDASPARVLDGVLQGGTDPGSAGGWAVVGAGLLVAATTYLVAVHRSVLSAGFKAGLGFGAFMWFVVGALVMPLLGLYAEKRFGTSMGAAPLMPSMPPTFMMIGSGPLAALSGLIAWLLFGGILAAGNAAARVKEPHARPSRTIVALGLVIAIEIAAGGALAGVSDDSYELWVIDQLGSGRLHIFEGSELIKKAPTAETIDFAKAASGVGDGVGEKPHMIRFSPGRTHALVPNALSGHVYVIRVSDRSVVASIDVGTDVHDVAPSRDGKVAVVSKMTDKKLGVIRTDYDTETFTYDEGDDLDLGALEDSGFPDNMPVCTLFPRNDRVAYVTMKGGGLFVVDAAASPPRIVKSFASDQIAASGCGAVTRDGDLYLGWGNPEISSLYILDYADHILTRSIPVDGYGPDGHGLALVGDGRYIWMAIRGSDSVLVIDTERDQVVGAIQSATILPDMPVVAPTGDLVFLTLRSANYYEDPKPGVRTTPGILVLDVVGGGAGGVPRGLITLPPSISGDAPDPHGIAVLPTND